MAVILVLAGAILASSFGVFNFANVGGNLDECYVGVAFCGNTTGEAKLLIDRVKDYTNLLIIQSGPVSVNETALNEICEYSIGANLDVIVFFGDLDPRIIANDTSKSWRTAWVDLAKLRWEDNLLGIYYYDEPGGMWLDTITNETLIRRGGLPSNATYSSIAQRAVSELRKDPGIVQLKNNSIPIFVSDYALYWFDYLAGYDVVFTEMGWNHSLAQDIALTRGAATLQDKEWGAIVTWRYDQAPYLDSGEAIYNQMVAAYQAGAKYITIFNYPQMIDNLYGVMQDEHFEALERFWNDAVNRKISHSLITAKAVLVLPKDYGWGMRHLNDRIWGYWGPDDKSPTIWERKNTLLEQYGYALDIVYEDSTFPVAGKYDHVYLWNSTDPIGK
jgi:hypothetical protein